MNKKIKFYLKIKVKLYKILEVKTGLIIEWNCIKKLMQIG